MLLLYRIGSRVVQPSWCNIGGHFESYELNNTKACALREVFEETGITESDITNLTFKYITLRNKNQEINLKNQDLQLKLVMKEYWNGLRLIRYLNEICPLQQKKF
jgi:8-oxo-dGTP pyrophosphatase MutT (NUDIX family)